MKSGNICSACGKDMSSGQHSYICMPDIICDKCPGYPQFVFSIHPDGVNA